jgi:hypothetical protein
VRTCLKNKNIKKLKRRKRRRRRRLNANSEP